MHGKEIQFQPPHVHKGISCAKRTSLRPQYQALKNQATSSYSLPCIRVAVRDTIAGSVAGHSLPGVGKNLD